MFIFTLLKFGMNDLAYLCSVLLPHHVRVAARDVVDG
jgi:hypothetical protein